MPNSRPTENLTILLVEDHELVRAGLRRLLEDHSSSTIIIEADTGESALELARRSQIDVVLMDLSLPGMSGEKASRFLLKDHPTIAIIVLTGKLPDQSARQLLQMGVLGYLTKGCSAGEMYRAIGTVMSGKQYLSGDVARQMVLNSDTSDESPFDSLTNRETEVVEQLLEGKRNRQIGEILFISEKTVSTHRGKAFQKLGVNSTVELARLAVTHGVLMV